MYKLITYSDELYHYGVKGMHWGVRRYQNYDGTRIGTGGEPVIRKGQQVRSAVRKSIAGGQGGKATGNARYAATAGGVGGNAIAPKTGSGNSKAKEVLDKATTKSIKQGKGKDDISPAEKISRDVRSGTEATKKASDILAKHDPKVKSAGDRAEQEAKKMSDKELRDSINRIKMEREYRSLAESDVQSGWQKASEVLDLVGDVASITLAIVGVIATIKSLKHSDTSVEEAELKRLLDLGDYDDDFIAHAMALDLDYVSNWLDDESELYHHGVKGMKWGVRRYQNYDGSRIGSGGKATGATDPSKKRSLKDYAYVEAYRDENNKVRLRFTSDGPKPFKIPPKNTVAGGQGGKAKGNERLATNTVNNPFKDFRQRKLAKETINNPSNIPQIARQNHLVSERTMRDLGKKYRVQNDAIIDASDDLIKESNYILAYDRRAEEWAKKNGANVKEYKKVEPYNPPETDKTRAAHKAMKEYSDACFKATKEIVGQYGDKVVPSESSTWANKTVEQVVHGWLDASARDISTQIDKDRK